MPLDPLFAELEQNITGDLSMERLAKAGLLSRSQLYREFYNTAGHTMGEYIRRRRLSNALALIKTSQLSLTDIAYQCGFSSHEFRVAVFFHRFVFHSLLPPLRKIIPWLC